MGEVREEGGGGKVKEVERENEKIVTELGHLPTV